MVISRFLHPARFFKRRGQLGTRPGKMRSGGGKFNFAK